MTLRFILLSVLLFSFQQAQSTTYYFSNNLGNDSWTGRIPLPNANLSDGPKKSILAFNTLLNTVARSGDSLLLRRGEEWISNVGIQSNAAQGTEDKYIAIAAYGSGAKPILQMTAAGDVLLCRGSANAASSYLKFHDLHLETKLPVGARPGGVYVGESFYTNKPHDLIFDHLTIRSCKYGMILYQNNIVVQNCSLELNGNQAEGQGIFCSASNVKFLNNVLDSNGCGSVFVHSIYISQTSDILFEGNEIKNADDGLKLRASNNLIIRNNKIHDTHIHSMHLGGDQASGCSNIIIEGNHCYNVPNGLRISSESGTQTLPTENVIVRNNIFPAMVHVSDNGPVKNIFFYNNLFHSAPGQPALWITNAANPQNIQLKNNLFYSTIPNNSHSLLSLIGSSGINGISLDHNLYYYPFGSRNILTVGNRTFQNLSLFQSAFSNQEVHGQQGNPNFINAPLDFHLSANSDLAMDKGINLDSVGLLDLDNNNRIMDGNNDGKFIIDIGPYEFCCVVAVPKIKTSDKIYVYPNPSNNIIHLQFREELPDYVRIFNVHGKEMYVVQPNDIQQQIDISVYPSGCYWISTSYFNNSNQTIKFLKL